MWGMASRVPPRLRRCPPNTYTPRVVFNIVTRVSPAVRVDDMFELVDFGLRRLQVFAFVARVHCQMRQIHEQRFVGRLLFDQPDRLVGEHVRGVLAHRVPHERIVSPQVEPVKLAEIPVLYYSERFYNFVLILQRACYYGGAPSEPNACLYPTIGSRFYVRADRNDRSGVKFQYKFRLRGGECFFLLFSIKHLPSRIKAGECRFVFVSRRGGVAATKFMPG